MGLESEIHRPFVRYYRLRSALLSDHCLSVLISCADDTAANACGVTEDKKVNNYVRLFSTH